MKKPTRDAGVAVTMAALLALASGCGAGSEEPGAEEPLELRLVHEEGDADVQGQYAQRFQELIEERTDGRMEVTLYAAGQLGTDQDKLKMVEDEAVQAAISTPNITASIVEENQVFSIPFVFSDEMEVNREVLRSSSALNEDLAGIYRERGVEVLSYWTEGFMAWTSNRPIEEPEGMEGLRIRTMTSPMLLRSYEQIGANPMPMDAGEIYTALQTHMIDATENPLFFIHSGNTYEVQDYLTLGRHDIYVTSTIMNADFLEGLPAEDRETVEEVVDELDEWVFELQEEMNDDALAAMEESTVEITELTDEQRETYREMSLPAREDYAETAGQPGAGILEDLVAEIEQAEAALEADIQEEDAQ